MLGSEVFSVRLGGIFALQCLALKLKDGKSLDLISERQNSEAGSSQMQTCRGRCCITQIWLERTFEHEPDWSISQVPQTCPSAAL